MKTTEANWWVVVQGTQFIMTLAAPSERVAREQALSVLKPGLDLSFIPIGDQSPDADQ